MRAAIGRAEIKEIEEPFSEGRASKWGQSLGLIANEKRTKEILFRPPQELGKLLGELGCAEDWAERIAQTEPRDPELIIPLGNR